MKKNLCHIRKKVWPGVTQAKKNNYMKKISKSKKINLENDRINTIHSARITQNDDYTFYVEISNFGVVRFELLESFFNLSDENIKKIYNKYIYRHRKRGNKWIRYRMAQAEDQYGNKSKY